MWNCGPVGNNRCSYGGCIKRAFWRREVFWNYRWIKYVLVSQYISVIYVSVPSADPIFLSTSPFCLSLYFFFSLCFHFSFSPIHPPPYIFLFSLSPSPSPPISIFSISISISLPPPPSIFFIFISISLSLSLSSSSSSSPSPSPSLPCSENYALFHGTWTFLCTLRPRKNGHHFADDIFKLMKILLFWLKFHFFLKPQ